MDFHAVLKSNWPIIVTAAGCIGAFATLSADVSNVKQEQTTIRQDLAKTKAEAQADHDAIVRMDERTKTMADDMKDVKTALKELASK